MKKSMILLGMLSIGYAYAQSTDPYEGKVGINTNEPKATLDITPEANNLTGTTNEGIIAPRLSKTRIANIEASKLTEGTLVYATDAVYTAGADTAKNGRVAKINEKGYYFYNGTEWVKVQYKDTDTNDAEWVYDDTTKRINLKRSGQTTGFTNKVYYNAQTGQSVNISSKIVGESVNETKLTSKITNIIDAKDVSKIENTSNKELATDIYYVSSDDDNNGGSIFGKTSNMKVLSGNNNTYTTLASRINNMRFSGSGNISNLYSISTSAIAEGQGNVTGSFIGLLGVAARRGTGKADVMYGIEGQAQIGGIGSIKTAVGLNGYVFSASNATASVDNAYGVRAHIRALNGSTAKIKNVMGFYATGFNDIYKSNMSVDNYYGVYIEDATSATKNYAIYSNAGKVRVGDLADTSATADRQVVVDADGVLKVANTEAAPTAISGKADIPCDETNRGKMNLIQDHTSNGKTFDVFGICLKGTNGYSWRYIYGNAGVSNGSGNFGSGLQ